MAALFAACVNDDFETISKQQNAASDGRPTVSDVKLEFAQAEDPATRVIFDGKYHWQSNDTIGALLMDNVKFLGENRSWLEKYGLVEYIHTSYPFTYNSTEDTWGCNTKMLEGNYFFAYPWESYDGQRKVTHSLLNQSQEGIGANVVAESYAKNQFFIGYSRIMAGAEAKDVLNTVEMVSTLGAIQLRITNTGTQTYHINKVVLSGHDDVASVLTFDPTDAQYGTTTAADKWNLQGTIYSNFFNYANYEGEESENELYQFGVAANPSDYVYNIESGDEYERNAALRAVVKEYPSTEQSAQLIINGSADERALRPHAANTAYVLIMCNPLEIGTANGTDKLLLSIYTDEGFVQNIDLAEIHAESADYTVVTDSKIEEVSPSKSNTIGIQIDDNSFIVPEKMDIYNSSDLLQFVKWNTTVVGERKATATLKQDVTFTAEILEALKANKNTSVTIDGTNELTLAEDVPANVLDDKQLTISNGTSVKVEGDLVLTEESDKVAVITVAEGATLSINEEKAVVSDIDNYGTLTLGANSAVAGSVEINNYGTMEVAKGGDCKATVTNYKDAVINNNGYMQGVTNNADAIINMGEASTLANVSNSGLIKTAKNAVVTGTNNADGEIQYVDGANLSGLTNSGDTSYEVTGTVIDKDSEFTNINKLIIKKAVTVTDAAGLAGIKEIEIADEGSLAVNKGVIVNVNNLLISGKAAVSGEGTVTVANVEVEEGAELTNSGNIVVSAQFVNNGTVYNNGYIATPNAYVSGNGTWKYNEVEDSNVPVDPKVTAMNNAVETWAAQWSTLDTKYYNGNPYDYEAFLATVNTGSEGDWWNDLRDKLLAAGFTTQELTSGAKAPAEFKAAVDTYLAGQAEAAEKLLFNDKGEYILTSSWTQFATLYDDEAAAKDAMSKSMNAQVNVENFFDDNVALAAYTWYAQDKVWTALTAEYPYAYIWKGCELDEVMTEYRKISNDNWKTALGTSYQSSGVSDMNGLKNWMLNVLMSNNTENAYVRTAKTVVEKYIDEYQEWAYSNAQVQAAGK